MALFINGVEQNTFSINGVELKSLFVDGVQVLNTTTFEIAVYSPTLPPLMMDFGLSNSPFPLTETETGKWYGTYDNNDLVGVFFNSDTSAITSIEFIKNTVLDKLDFLVATADVPANSLEHITFYSGFDFSTIESMRSTFVDMPALVCMNRFDTTGVSTKSDIFTGTTALQYPDATDQADLEDVDGANWVNSNDCPRPVYLRETLDGSCTYDEGGTCAGESFIDAVILDPYTTVTYAWTVTGATATSPLDADYCTITTPSGSTDVPYTVECVVTVDGIVYNLSADYVMTKNINPIIITGISQDISGSCDPI